MSLPKLNTPVYEAILPSTNKVVKFRPFLVKEEKLSLLEPQINLKTNFLKLIYKDKEIFNGFLNNNNDIKKLNLCLANFLNINLKKKPRLVTDKSDVKNDNKHSFSDIPDKALSFINLNTVNDFEVKIKQEVNYNRFRGNVIFSGIKAWEEFNWLGKIITIGGVKFEILEKLKGALLLMLIQILA